MLKFFRKIRRSVLYKVKVSKYLLYASGEILLVVVGILIALQINNWNEARKNLDSQRVALNDLQDEFRRNRALFDRSLALRKQFIGSCDSIIILSKGNYSDLGDIALWGLIGNCFREATFDPALGQYDGLVNSGRIALVSSDSLRMILTTWPSAIEDLREDEEVSRQFSWQLKNEFLPDKLDLVNKPREDLISLLQDVGFMSRVAQQNFLHMISNNQSGRVRKALDRIIILLEEEVGKLK